MHRKDQEKESSVSPEENKRTIRRIYDGLWNGRRLEVADELIAEGAVNYDTGLVASLSARSR
jgi:hypothetical protein